MKKFLMAVAALACMGSVALAGPNAGGTLIAHDANLQYTNEIPDYCGLGTGIPGCECLQADVRIDGSSPDNIRVWKVYAAFCATASPRLKGMTFGVTYDPAALILTAWGNCCGDPNNGAAEFPGAGWPGRDTGTSLVFQITQTGCLTECYWFAGYAYYGAASLFCLRDNPDPVLGGNFADDSVPSLLDPIACYGCMGFEMPGTVCCPECGGVQGACCVDNICYIMTPEDCDRAGGEYLGDNSDCGPPDPCEPPPVYGACCDPETGGCTITTEADCRPPNVWHPEWTSCDPNLCPQPPNPVEATSWGQIKANYR
jgi:hypothetical protein